MTHRLTICAAAAIALSVVSCSHKEQQCHNAPEWFETDSVQAISARMRKDFSLTIDQAVERLAANHPDANADSVMAWADKHYVELKEIDGELRMHRRSVGNLDLLHPDFNDGWRHRGWNASEKRISYADSVISWKQGKLATGGAHRVKGRFTIDVPWHPALAGDTIRVWMPYPLEADRQSDVAFVSSFPEEHIITPQGASAHNTIYFEQAMPKDSVAPLHFEYVVEFTAKGAYFPVDKLKQAIKPYDKTSEVYIANTAFEGPHIVRLDSLANAIVGESTDPLEQHVKVYEHIINTYPWAGAREYSTIPCIPQYVLDEGHGDCGQVALLYISLMRTLGVPARWESGWMLHPGEKNLHDWAEVYFEGVGWVPVDPSFGYYEPTDKPLTRTFYSTGIDAHRFVANKGVGDALYPPKKYLRSETVDSQLGEVESTHGNLFYGGWDQEFEILSVTPVEI